MPSIIEKYEQIFAADPRSRIFVELARALLERGSPERAIDVCMTGLEHHPSSILGRVIWGRSLLALGDLPGAQDQFEIGIALDPASPYAYNLVGEALYTKELYREALPVLARAVDLQPADARLKGWLEDARGRVQGTARAPGSVGEVVDEPTRPQRLARPAPSAPPASAPPSAAAEGEKTPPLGSVSGPVEARPARTATPRPQVVVPLPAPASVTPRPQAVPLPAPGPSAPPAPPPLDGARAGAPPPVPAVPPPRRSRERPSTLLSMIPGATRQDLAAVPAAPPAQPDEDEADRITAKFEQEVRQRLLSEPEGPVPFHRRHRRLLWAAVLLCGAAAAVLVFVQVRGRSQAEVAARAVVRARAGLARDTVGALREASQLLAEARRGSSAPELISLSAQIAAVLASEHGDAEARALAKDLAARKGAGDGGMITDYLLAGAPAEQVSSEAAILGAPPSSEPMVQALAGRILLRRGELAAGKGRLEIAARATPPLLRALSDLGDAAMAAGDPEGALGYYGAALSAHATHPRSVVGAAEARLALNLDLGRARAELEAVAADPGSAPPADLRVRFEIASARVLAAVGDPAGAAARLARATEKLGETAALASAAAEIHLAARAYDRAETAAERAVSMSPGDTGAKVLLARARIGRGRYAEALTATAKVQGRAVWVQRAIARYHLGQLNEARRELERTAKDGRMPGEAAVWYALTEVRLGRAEQARALLEKLAATHAPPPMTWVALGQALEALKRTSEAEAAYRTAAERDPAAPEAHAALGVLLQSRGANADAVPELQKAVSADPAALDARRALAAARLATGQPAMARAEVDAVLLARPADLDALEVLSAAWLAEGQPREARRAADRGLARAPGRPSLLMAAARAAQAEGDRADARKLADRAVKTAGRGPDAAAARALQAELRRR